MKKSIILVIVIIILLVLLSAIILNSDFFKTKETKREEAEVKQIDNRISPLENQGLFVEISRVRHRGLYDKITERMNRDWKNPPNFFVVTRSEGIEYSTKDMVSLGVYTEYYFDTWDTMFMEYKNQFNPDEEQETSFVEIIIYEQESSGFLGRNKVDVEKEKIELTYDYRTGRWNGKSDSFNDKDGYGHYLGDTFEVWFRLHQIDYDQDTIPYWTEVNILGTDPKVDDSMLDPDKDGIPTDWEWFWGYDPFTWDDHRNLDPDIDGIENIEEYRIRKWFANPFQQDIYCEVDNMEGKVLDLPAHMMWEESIQAIIEIFSRNNINIYLDQGWPGTPHNGGGTILPFYKTSGQDSGMITQFFKHYFPDERKGIFHYIVVGNEGGFTHPTEDNTYYTCHIYVNDIAYRRYFKAPVMFSTPRTWRSRMAGTFMHELGHSLGLASWTFEGIDNHTTKTLYHIQGGKNSPWVNYNSVMNYGKVTFWDIYREFLDYSHGENAETGYDMNDWEALYLPTFQTVSICNEDITAFPPALHLCEFELEAVELLEFEMKDMEFDENLTNDFLKMVGDWSPIDPIDVTFRAYKKIEENRDSSYEIKIFGLAEVYPTYSEYLLVKEGFINSVGELQFYSQQSLIEDAMTLI